MIEKLGQEARHQARVFDSLLSTTADFNYIFDRQGRFSYINQALLSLLGLTQDQALGRNFHDLKYPADLAAKLQSQIEEVFVTGKQLKDETPFTNPDGKWGYYEYIFVPSFDADGRVEAVCGSTRDISEHKRAQLALKASDERLAALNRDLEKLVIERTEQLRQKDQQLFQAQKLEALGRLSGGVAHDFNNLVTGIIGITEDIRDQLGPESPHHADLEEVIKAGQKASALTRQLLAFGRRQVSTQKVLNWNSVILDMNRMFARLLGEDVEVVLSLDPRLSNVKADQSHLEQVVVNLILNARDAISGGGKIYLTTSNVDLDHDPSQRHFNIAPGPYVCLTIADTGTGISPDVLAHMFEPFFTTKGQGKGTGLGLATVYGIIKQNNGDISVYSELGKGTTFKIYLPSVSDSVGIQPHEALRQGGPGGVEKILVVEDEDIVRRVTVKALKKRGYTVFEARNGEEALTMIQHLPGPLDLLVTDVVMPGMNGRVVADRISEQQPGIRVLFMSGHAQDVMFERGIIDPGIAFIEKSFSADAFCRKVRDVLDTAIGG